MMTEYIPFSVLASSTGKLQNIMTKEINKYTVLISKELVNKFPKIPHLKGIEICQELEKEAFAFTSFAHRYLQNELFKTILEYFKESGHDGLYEWFKQQEFVIDPILDKAVPWTEYKKTH